MVAEIRTETSNGDLVRSLPNALPSLEDGPCSSRIVSLYELMKPIPLGLFVEHLDTLNKVSLQGSHFTESAKHVGREIFENLEEAFDFYEMAASLETSRKLSNFVNRNYLPEDPSEFHNLIVELRGRMIDEMKGREFFALSAHETRFYRSPTKKWEVIVERFPEALSDTEEAWKCLALSRYTAAVFHSLQIIETGLIELGKFIEVNDPLSGWTSVSQRLKQIVEKPHSHRTDFQKENFPFLEQVQGTVAGLKNAGEIRLVTLKGG